MGRGHALSHPAPSGEEGSGGFPLGEGGHRNALQGMASSYRALGRTEEALVGYRRLLEIAGADTGASIAIADIEFDRGNLDAAAETLHQAVATSCLAGPGQVSSSSFHLKTRNNRSGQYSFLSNPAIWPYWHG